MKKNRKPANIWQILFLICAPLLLFAISTIIWLSITNNEVDWNFGILIAQSLNAFAYIAIPIIIILITQWIKAHNANIRKSNQNTVEEANRHRLEIEKMIKDYLKPIEDRFKLHGKTLEEINFENTYEEKKNAALKKPSHIESQNIGFTFSVPRKVVHLYSPLDSQHFPSL